MAGSTLTSRHHLTSCAHYYPSRNIVPLRSRQVLWILRHRHPSAVILNSPQSSKTVSETEFSVWSIQQNCTNIPIRTVIEKYDFILSLSLFDCVGETPHSLRAAEEATRDATRGDETGRTSARFHSSACSRSAQLELLSRRINTWMKVLLPFDNQQYNIPPTPLDLLVLTMCRWHIRVNV